MFEGVDRAESYNVALPREEQLRRGVEEWKRRRDLPPSPPLMLFHPDVLERLIREGYLP